MISDPDVVLYLQRLGVEARPPSIEALFELFRAQVERVPYETTWIHLEEGWNVDQSASLNRVATAARGGYCFHLNGALARLLGALGYDVTLHRGGVHGPDGIAEGPHDNHLVLLVHGLPTEDNEAGTWWVDAGLGDALHEPLPLRPGTWYQAPLTFRLEQVGTPNADWHFIHDPQGSFVGMAFSSTPAQIEDFAERNVHLSTSPESGFVKLVTVQRRDATGVDIMRGLVLRRVTEPGAGVAERTMASADEWFGVLGNLFGLPLDDVSAQDRERLWDRVSATHDAWVRAQAGES